MRIFILALFSITTSFAQDCLPCNCSNQKSSWKLIKKEGLHIDTMLVKTSGAYISESEINHKKYYEYIRFFPDGSVFHSCTYCSFPTLAQLNNLNYGTRGQYIVENNQIKVESWGTYVGYNFVFYKIESKSIILNGTCKRKWPEPKQRDYTEIKRTFEFFPL